MAVTGISANRLELLQIADAVAREKSIEKEIVISASEEAIQNAARTRYGAEHDIRVQIDPRTGEMAIKRVTTVVEDGEPIENEYAFQSLSDALRTDPEAFAGKTYEEELPFEEPPGIIRLSDAKRRDKDAVVGKVYEELLPPVEFGRVQTQMARQVVMGKVRDAERERQNPVLRSSKDIVWDARAKKFHVFNDIDQTVQHLTERQLMDESVTNIGYAMKKGALFKHDY